MLRKPLDRFPSIQGCCSDFQSLKSVEEMAVIITAAGLGQVWSSTGHNSLDGANHIYRVHFPGAVNSKFTTTLNFQTQNPDEALPTFRIVDQDGVVVDKERAPLDVTDEEALAWYRDMLEGPLALHPQITTPTSNALQ